MVVIDGAAVLRLELHSFSSQKTHSAFTATFRHAHVIHDEQIDFQIVSATPSDFHFRCVDTLNNFDTTSLTQFSIWYRCPVEGIFATTIVMTITFKTFDFISGHAFGYSTYISNTNYKNDKPQLE